MIRFYTGWGSGHSDSEQMGMFAALRSFRPPSHLRRPLLLFQLMSTRSYSDAVDALNSLQSNTATLEALRASGGRASDFAIPEMLEYLHRIGHNVSFGLVQGRIYLWFTIYDSQASGLNKLNVIHITGTKGKGSTSAFTDSILRQVKPEWKVGEKSRVFYSSRL